MDVDKIAKSLMNVCKDCGERFRCDKGEQLIYCPNRDAAERLKELSDFQSSQCAKLLARLTASYARIAELEAEVQAYKKHGLEPCDYAGIVVSDNKAKQAQNDLSVLMKECVRLQSHDKEAMELLEAAVSDILSFDSRPCRLCKFGNATWIMPNHCEDCDSLETIKTNWEWQYADRYEALKAQSPAKNTDGEG